MTTGLNETHDPSLRSWVESANDPATDFPIQNLPWCRFRIDEPEERDSKFGTGQWEHLGIVIGDQILDLAALDKAQVIDLKSDLDLHGPYLLCLII